MFFLFSLLFSSPIPVVKPYIYITPKEKKKKKWKEGK
jgi:hypothetical protein